jgi:hypothetical protein
MNKLKYVFKIDTKSYYPYSEPDKPTIIYTLLNSNKKVVIGLNKFNNCILEIDSKKYFIGPPANKISFGEINILNNEKINIGDIDYYGSKFKRKKVHLFNELTNSNEEWIIDNEENLFKRLLSNNLEVTTLTNGNKIVSIEDENDYRNWKEKIFEDAKLNIVINSNQNFENIFVIVGILTFLHILKKNSD